MGTDWWNTTTPTGCDCPDPVPLTGVPVLTDSIDILAGDYDFIVDNPADLTMFEGGDPPEDGCAFVVRWEVNVNSGGWTFAAWFRSDSGSPIYAATFNSGDTVEVRARVIDFEFYSTWATNPALDQSVIEAELGRVPCASDWQYSGDLVVT